jgi:hypothetical protein
VDTGELSPWVTWPTLHRGMNNERHGIRNLGRIRARSAAPRSGRRSAPRGGSIGIFGSMRAGSRDPGKGGFGARHVRSATSAASESVSGVQRSTSRSATRNARGHSAFPRIGEAIAFVRACIAPGSLLHARAARRGRGPPSASCRTRARAARSYQTVIFWDLFRRQFDAAQPPPSRPSSQPCRGVMHRYWKDVFPRTSPDAGEGATREPVMRFALECAGRHPRRRARLVAHQPRDLVWLFAGEHGAKRHPRHAHEGVELAVDDSGA